MGQKQMYTMDSDSQDVNNYETGLSGNSAQEQPGGCTVYSAGHHGNNN